MKKLILLFITSFYAWSAFAQTQTIRGQITDKQAEYPLIGATVVIVDSDPLVGTTTDAEGYFVLQNVPVGRVALKISYLGYKEQFLPNILVTSGKEVYLPVALEEQITVSEEIVITAEKDKTVTNNELTTVSARSFTIEESSRYAGSRNDPARMASNFAGVSGANDARNDIVIRGNSPTGVLWRLEGIDIPSPNHFGTVGTTGGPVGMLNNNVLANSDFMTGAFPAEYGNANAGVFDLKMRNGNRFKREYLFQIGFAGFEVGLEGPFSKNSKASYLVNYRYSTLAVFDALGIAFGTGTAVPQYQDLSFNIDIPTKNAGKFRLWGLGGFSNIDLLGSDTEDPDPDDSFGDINNDSFVESGAGTIGLSHIYYFNKKTYSEVSIALSGNYNRFKNDSLNRDENGKVLNRFFDQALDFSQTKVSIRAELNKKFNAKNTLRLGFISDFMGANLVDSVLLRPQQEFFVRRDVDGSSTLLRGYAQWQHRFNDRLTLNTGLHYQHFLLNESIAIEPRVGLKYNVSANSSINLGFGMHSQLQTIQSYYQDTELADGQIVRTNEDLDFTRSIHYVLGYDLSFGNNFRLKAEAYYQQIYDAAVEQSPSSFSMLNAGADFGIPAVDSLVNNGTGFNYGIELTLEKFYSQGYYFLLTTSLFDSRYEGSDDIERNTAFNGNYVFNGLFGKEWKIKDKNALFFDTKFTLAGGQRYTPINLEKSIASGFTEFDEDRAFSMQNEAYWRLDFKVGYRINAKRLTHEFFVDIQNVTNRENIFQRSFNRTTGEIDETFQLGLFPVVQYKLQF